MRKTLMLTACLAAFAGPAIAQSPDAYTSVTTAAPASIPYDPAAPYVRTGGPAATLPGPVMTPPPSTAAAPPTDTPQTDTMNPQMNPRDVRSPHR